MAGKTELKGLNLEEATIEGTLKKLKELTDRYENMLKEGTNMFDTHLEENKIYLRDINNKLISEFEKLKKFKTFYEFMFERLTPKQKDDFIQYLMSK